MSTGTNNLTLYRVLVKLGATDTEAESAATLDTSTLATGAQLGAVREELAALRESISSVKWMFGLTWTLLALILGVGVQVLLLLRRP
jgi:hypothetical protein